MTRWSKCTCLSFAVFLLQMGWTVTGFTKTSDSSELNSKVGVIFRDSKGDLLLEIPNNNVKQGTKVVTITLPSKSLLCCVEISKPSSPAPGTTHQAIFDNYSFYKLKMPSKDNYVSFDFGIIESFSVFSSQAGKVMADLNGDGVQETFRNCTSHEGVHLTIWNGQPLEDSKLWHAYFYLGYETEPSCVNKDYE